MYFVEYSVNNQRFMHTEDSQNHQKTPEVDHTADASQQSNKEQQSASNPDPFDRFSEAVKNSFERGEYEAKRTLKDAVPKLKQGLWDGVKELAFGAGFAGGVASFFANEIMPEEVKNSFNSGRSAGEERAASWKADRERNAANDVDNDAPAPEKA